MEAIPLWVHYEKAKFFGKDINAGGKKKQQETRKLKCEVE